jgi:hypothetical protein
MAGLLIFHNIIYHQIHTLSDGYATLQVDTKYIHQAVKQ